jgi:hypothetical protein
MSEPAVECTFTPMKTWLKHNKNISFCKLSLACCLLLWQNHYMAKQRKDLIYACMSTIHFRGGGSNLEPQVDREVPALCVWYTVQHYLGLHLLVAFKSSAKDWIRDWPRVDGCACEGGQRIGGQASYEGEERPVTSINALSLHSSSVIRHFLARTKHFLALPCRKGNKGMEN